MKLLHFLALLPAALPLTGCSIINMAAGPGDYYRSYDADNRKRSIDGAIQDELRKEPPGDSRTKPYSRSLWNRYWNEVVQGSLKEVPHPQYRGPSDEWFVDYMIRERQRAGLPAIQLTAENRKRLRAAGIPTGG
jgi:hypothetical protein